MKKKILVFLVLAFTLTGIASAQSQNLFYNFNQTADDFSGNNNDGTLKDSPTQADGFFQFDGSNWVETGESSSLDNTFDGDFTGIVAFNASGTNDGIHVPFFSYGNGNFNEWVSFEFDNVNTDHGLALYVDEGGTKLGVQDGSQSYDNGNLYCAGAVNDVGSNEMRIVVNGTTTSTSGSAHGMPVGNTQTLWVASAQGGGGSYSGGIWGVRLYEGVLNNSQIQSRCEELLVQNSPPTFNSVSTSPSNWTVGDSIDFNYDVSDSDGTVETVRLEVFDQAGNLEKGENFTYSSSSVTDTQTGWYSPQVEDNYTVYFTAWDDAGAETVETLSKTSQETSNEPPVFNETTLVQGAIVGGSPQYQAEAYDSENSLGFISLDITYGSQSRFSESVNSSNGNLVLFDNTFNISSANKWLNATFTANDSEGAEVTQEVNTFISDTRPSFQINDPDNITYQGKDIPYQVDFNDDGDDDPNEQAYCEAYNDGNLVRNATVDESNAGSFSGTIQDVSYGFHEFFVSCVEFDQTGNFTTNKSVFYSNEEKPPTVTINQPKEGEEFTYLDGTGGVEVRISGNVETDFSGTLEIYETKFGNTILDDVSIPAGVTEFNVTHNFRVDAPYTGRNKLELNRKVYSDDTDTFYINRDIRGFFVENLSNPAPYFNETKFPSSVRQGENVNFSVKLSDYTNGLGSLSARIVSDGGGIIDSTVLQAPNGSKVSWFNFTDEFTAPFAGEYQIRLNAEDNFGFDRTLTHNFTVSEKSPRFNLTFPSGEVATNELNRYKIGFVVDAYLPSPGNLTVEASTPDNNSFFKVGTANITSLGTQRVDSIEYNFTDILYRDIAGEQYRASDEYEWRVYYTSNISGTTYDSSISEWVFTSEDEKEKVSMAERIRNFVRYTAIALFIILAMGIPVYLRLKWGDDGLLG